MTTFTNAYHNTETNSFSFELATESYKEGFEAYCETRVQTTETIQQQLLDMCSTRAATVGVSYSEGLKACIERVHNITLSLCQSEKEYRTLQGIPLGFCSDEIYLSRSMADTKTWVTLLMHLGSEGYEVTSCIDAMNRSMEKVKLKVPNSLLRHRTKSIKAVADKINKAQAEAAQEQYFSHNAIEKFLTEAEAEYESLRLAFTTDSIESSRASAIAALTK